MWNFNDKNRSIINKDRNFLWICCFFCVHQRWRGCTQVWLMTTPFEVAMVLMEVNTALAENWPHAMNQHKIVRLERNNHRDVGSERMPLVYHYIWLDMYGDRWHISISHVILLRPHNDNAFETVHHATPFHMLSKFLSNTIPTNLVRIVFWCLNCHQ